MTPFPSTVEPAMSTEATWRGDRSDGLLEAFPAGAGTAFIYRAAQLRACRQPHPNCRLPLLKHSDSLRVYANGDGPARNDWAAAHLLVSHGVRLRLVVWFDSSTRRPYRDRRAASGQSTAAPTTASSTCSAHRCDTGRHRPALPRPSACPTPRRRLLAAARTHRSVRFRQASPPAPQLRPSRLVPPLIVARRAPRLSNRRTA
jgi:hypothetical protein